MLDLSIIIVSWNVRALLEKCVASIEATRGALNLKVFVVDNASVDGTRDVMSHVTGHMSNVHFIYNEVNRGFASANNQGIQEARGKYVLLLNPDTEVQVGALEGMVRFMEEQPRCGILGPRLVNPDWSHQPSVRRFPDTWSPTFLSLGIKTNAVKKYLAEDMDYGQAQQVDQVMGAAFMIRREVIDQIGLLDENFFIWFEEVDYCKRAKDARWEVWYTPDAVVMHYGGQSFAQVMTLKKQKMFTRSLLYYFWKHRQYGSYALNALTVPIRLFVSALFH